MKFFIQALGRSGSMWLAHILDKTEAQVLHEPYPEDIRAYPEAYHSPKKAQKYIENVRSDFIDEKKEVYGEVNSYLRRHTKALKKQYPDAKFLHLVRDGRYVVRSMFSRGAFGAKNGGTFGIFPLEESEWYQMNQFERCCWYWKTENEYLRENIDKFVRLKHLTSDWEYFKTNILDFLDLELPKEIWEAEKGQKRNKSKRHLLKSPEKWSQSRKDTFNRICEKELQYYE